MKEKPKIFRKLRRGVTANAKLTRPIDNPGSIGTRSSSGISKGHSSPIAGVRRLIDATTEPDPGPAPEVIFDRATGPFSAPRYSFAPGTRVGGS